MSRTLLTVVLSVFVATAGGCLVVSGKSIEERGTLVSARTLDQIDAGSTTEAWVLAVLGEPCDERVVDGHRAQKILRYDHTVTVAEGGAVFLIFAGGSETRETTSVFFEVTDGIVTRYWTEP